jgi:hypothetical protein
MSTFMGLAWVDLGSGADVEVVLAELLRAAAVDETAGPATVEPTDLVFELCGIRVVEPTPGRARVELAAGGDYAALADLVVHVAGRTGLVDRAFIALDHDEYGAEHIVLDARGGTVRRVHHIYVYPCDEETGEPYLDGAPSLTGVPLAGDTPLWMAPGSSPGSIVDGPVPRAATAALYGVPPENLDRAARAAARAHAELGVVGAPFGPWLDALGIAWIGKTAGRTIRLGRHE